jgi:hypothetical protein
MAKVWGGQAIRLSTNCHSCADNAVVEAFVGMRSEGECRQRAGVISPRRKEETLKLIKGTVILRRARATVIALSYIRESATRAISTVSHQ